MRILVTGATGFIGTYVSRELAAAGRRPRLMFRRPHRAALIAPLEAELVAADLRSRDSLTRALDGVDAVIHMAARATFEPHRLLAPTLVDGTRMLAEEAADAGVRVIVFASSSFVYPGGAAAIDRDTAPAPVIDYGRAKLEAERVLEAVGVAAGLRVVSLRLPHTYGPTSLLFHYARRGLVVFGGDQDAVFSHLHVTDAARALIAAVDGDLEGGWPLADRQPASWREFFAVLTTYLPYLRVWNLPAPQLERTLRLLLPLLARRRRPSLVAPDTIAGWRLDQRIDAGATWSALGIEPLCPSVYTGIPATLDAAVPYRWRHPIFDRRPG